MWAAGSGFVCLQLGSPAGLAAMSTDHLGCSSFHSFPGLWSENFTARQVTGGWGGWTSASGESFVRCWWAVELRASLPQPWFQPRCVPAPGVDCCLCPSGLPVAGAPQPSLLSCLLGPQQVPEFVQLLSLLFLFCPPALALIHSLPDVSMRGSQTCLC